MRRITPYSIFRGLLATILSLAGIGVLMFFSWLIAICAIIICIIAVVSSESGSECWEKISELASDIWSTIKDLAHSYKSTWTSCLSE